MASFTRTTRLLWDVLAHALDSADSVDAKRIPNSVILETVYPELLSLGADLGEKPHDKLMDKTRCGLFWTEPEFGVIVGDDCLHDERTAVALVSRRQDVHVVSNEIDHLSSRDFLTVMY